MSYIGNQPYQVAFLTNQYSGDGTTTAFTMSVAPATTTSVLVAITGVLQDPTTYSVVGTTLTFSAAPPAGTGNISVRYLGIPASGVTTTAYRTVTEFTATAGQTTFSVPSYTVGYIDVYRNGARLGAADYTATNGTTVVLVNACTVGDLVTIESFFVSSVVNAIANSAGAVQTSNLADASITTAKIANGAVVQADLDTLVVPLGVGQTWQDVTASRALGTTYTNTTGRPIFISARPNASVANTSTQLNVSGVVAFRFDHPNATFTGTLNAVVPNGATYVVTVIAGSATLSSWSELR